MKTITKTGLLLIVSLAFAVTLPSQEIFDAVRTGDLNKVKELVEINPELVKVKDQLQRTPLHIAVRTNKDDMTKYLIEKGADINDLAGGHRTPLMFAELVNAKVLVEKGADINIEASNKYTALIWAFSRGKKEVGEYLLALGAKIPEVDHPIYMQALSSALKNGSIAYLDRCLQQGIDPQYEDKSKNNFLHFASEGNSLELINKLIGLGVPINKTDIYGRTALHIAAYSGHKEVVEFLIRKGLDLNVRTIDDRTAYHFACEANNTEVVNLLISLGADQSPRKFPELRGEYLGQPKPGKKAIPFALGIVSAMPRTHRSITFSPDGTEAYWSVHNSYSIYGSKIVDGKWDLPRFISKGEMAFISPDGKKLFFLLEKEIQGRMKEVIYVKDKTADGWSEASPLPDNINLVHDIHMQVSVDLKGNLYFCSFGKNGEAPKIYCSENKNGMYAEPCAVDNIDHAGMESHYMAPDGSYFILQSEGLKIVFRKKDGSWTKAKSLDDVIGVEGGVLPFVTHDGKYLFFHVWIDDSSIPYWVDASFIEDLRKEALKDDK